MRAIAEAQGFAPRPQALGRVEAILTDRTRRWPPRCCAISSARRTEADHIIGDLLARRPPSALRASAASPPTSELSVLEVA